MRGREDEDEGRGGVGRQRDREGMRGVERQGGRGWLYLSSKL